MIKDILMKGVGMGQIDLKGIDGLCPTCKLPVFYGPVSYAGPMCTCRFNYGLNPIVINVHVNLQKENHEPSQMSKPNSK